MNETGGLNVPMRYTADANKHWSGSIPQWRYAIKYVIV